MNQPAKNAEDARTFYMKGAQQSMDKDYTAALENMRKAVELEPRNADYNNGVGHTLQMLGQMAEARKYLTQAVTLDPGMARAWRNLGVLCRDINDYKSSVEAMAHAVSLNPSEGTYVLTFMEVFSTVKVTSFSEWFKNIVIMCLKNNQVEHRIMNRGWAWFFENDPLFKKIEEANKDIPDDLNDLFLRLGLQKMYICSMRFEKAMTKLRQIFLTKTVKDKEAMGKHVSFLQSLSSQCWLNECIYSVTDDEKKLLTALKKDIEAGTKDTPDYIAKICLYGCYAPIRFLSNAKEILKVLRAADSSLAMLGELQIAEPMEEEEIKKTIPSTIKITDDISKKVQQQYEENPYPRWKYFASVHQPKPEAIDILIAGCGTGMQSAMTALGYPNANIHNVDLSLSSLAYGIRQTRAMGLDKLTFEQRDILELGNLNRQFDMIECVGVLHHMKEPDEGIKVLIKLLKPEGRMCIGLYSEIARRDVVAVRDFIAKEKLGGTSPDEIRALREKIARHPDKLVSACALRNDFYSMSGCRDLVLHVQEHRYTIPKLKKLLKDHNLKFEGFYFSRKKFVQIFEKHYPDKKDAHDLDVWEEFENKAPTFFAGMYSFWVSHA